MSFKAEFEKNSGLVSSIASGVAGVARSALSAGAKAAVGTAKAIPKAPGAIMRGIGAVGKESAGFVAGPVGLGLTALDVNDKRKAINAAASRPLGG